MIYEVWEVVKLNDYEYEPLILVGKFENIKEALKIKAENKNFIITNNKGVIIND